MNELINTFVKNIENHINKRSILQILSCLIIVSTRQVSMKCLQYEMKERKEVTGYNIFK